jgi:hypothetical protein
VLTQLNILAIIFFSLTLTSCDLNYVDYIHHIESPDKNYNFVLYSDAIGIGDPGFMVLKLEKEINPETVKVKWNYKNGSDKKDAEWLYSRQILYNYEESGNYASNPKIDLIDNRFLVFSRGGYYLGLYDIKLQKDVFNNCCPFGDWASQNIWAKNGTNYKGDIPKDESSDYGIWIEKNIHNKIKDYIRMNK